MAGSLSERATLASDSTFINNVRAAMLYQANYTIAAAPPASTTNAQMEASYTLLQKMRAIIANAGSGAANVAWIVATTDPTVGPAAPVVPSDVATQAAVNAVLVMT